MEIIKNKRKCKCGICFKQIDGKYKVSYNKNYNRYHLSCFWKHINDTLTSYNKMKKQYTPTIKKHLILEKL